MADGQDAASGDVRPPDATEAEARRWVLRFALATTAVLAVAAVVIALLGGFARRSDYVVLAAGQEVDAGNLAFTLDSATAQPDTDYTGAAVWVVRVSGRVRNPHDTSLAPRTGSTGNLAVRTGAGGAVAELDSVTLGEATSRTQVPPDGLPMAMTATFRLPGDFQPGTTLECGVFVQEYTENTILGLARGAKEWNVDSFARPRLIHLPLTVLPAEQ